MRYHFSGVLVACICAAGVLCCSDDSSVTANDEPVVGNDTLSQDGAGVLSSGSVSGSSAQGAGDNLSQAGDSQGGPQSGTSQGDSQASQSGTSQGGSQGALPGSSQGPGMSSGGPAVASSSSVTDYVYVAPENFSDTVNGVAFNMVYVPGGSYTRGCDNCAEQDKIYETPSHKVTVDAYHIAPTEVTIAQWNAVMGGKKNAWESDKAPKIGVSWFDANNFACKLGQLTGHQYRLLTDAEWEFAARGGKDGVADKFKFSGSNTADDVAWYSENSGGKAHDVATKKANKLGLYDMSGNSWEWVYDWLVGYTAGDKVNPVQLTGSGNKTRRGGSYGEPAEFARVSRRAIRSRDGAADMGFRLGASTELVPGMVSACEAANPSDAVCVGDKNRDCRLITAADEAWISDDYTVVIGEDGLLQVFAHISSISFKNIFLKAYGGGRFGFFYKLTSFTQRIGCFSVVSGSGMAVESQVSGSHSMCGMFQRAGLSPGVASVKALYSSSLGRCQPAGQAAWIISHEYSRPNSLQFSGMPSRQVLPFISNLRFSSIHVWSLILTVLYVCPSRGSVM